MDMLEASNTEIPEIDVTGDHEALLEYSGDIACAYISNNYVPSSELPGLVKSIYESLAKLISSKSYDEIYTKPTVDQIKKSVRPNGIISFIDGKSYKTLKRHLKSHGLDGYGYIQRYGLPENYPMTCSNFSAARSRLAMQAGLGRSSAARNAVAEASEKKPPRSSLERAAK